MAALLALVAVPTAQAATAPAPILPSGATVLTLSPIAGYVPNTLQGAVCQPPSTNTCVEVDYFPFYTPGGVAALDTAIDTTIGTTPNTKVVVFAYSNGAQVAEHWLAEHADDPDAPSANQLSFVLLGNSTRAYGGVDAGLGVAPQTQYHVVDVARQYDLTVDFPDNPFNLLALANVFAGLVFMHDYRPVNINDPANFVWTVGNTTYVLVPTENLPLLEPLRWVGLSGLADALNGPLKEIVEQGYDRSYLAMAQPAPTAITTAAPSTLSTTVVAESTVASQDTSVPVSLALAPVVTPAPEGAVDSAPRAVETKGDDTDVATTPRAVPSRLDTATQAEQSTTASTRTTAPTAGTTTTSTTNGHKAVTGKAGGNHATTKSGDQATSTKDSKKAAASKG